MRAPRLLAFATFAGLGCAANAADAQTTATSGPRVVAVRLESNEDGVGFERATGDLVLSGSGNFTFPQRYAMPGGYSFSAHATTYESLCVAPCTTTLPNDWVRFRINRDGDLVTPDPVFISGSGTLHANFESHRDLRIAGFITLIASVAVGTILIVTSVHKDDQGNGSVSAVQLGVGGGVLVIGGIVGAGLAVQKDGLRFLFGPMMTGANGGRREGQGPAATDARGLAAQMTF